MYTGYGNKKLFNINEKSVYIWYANNCSGDYYNGIYGNGILCQERSHPVAASMLGYFMTSYARCFVQPVVYLKSNLSYEYDSETNTYTILGYK